MLTLGYLIPGIYLFIRIWILFIPKEFRLRYVVISTMLFMIYPLGNLAGDDSAGVIAKITATISNYLLPFFLYLFLFVLLTDLLLLIIIIFKILPREKLRQRSLRLKIFAVIVCLPVIIVIAGAINFNSIRISEYEVEVQKRSSDLSHLRIAFISDFHIKEDTPVGFVKKAVQKANRINPDIMLFGGDIFEGGREDGNIKEVESLLKGIKSKYGVYGVLGNHEHYSRQDRGSFFNRAGIEIIVDSAVIFSGSFILAGRNDSHIRTRKDVNELISSLPDSLPVILLDHRPSEIMQVTGTLTDILLSGHTHHGQLFPINFITRRVYDLSMGYRKFGNTHVFVSSGIRLWGFPVRTTGKSEIVVINVSFI